MCDDNNSLDIYKTLNFSVTFHSLQNSINNLVICNNSDGENGYYINFKA